MNLVHRKAHRQLCAFFHQRPDDLQLLMGEINKAVDIDVIVRADIAVGYLGGQNIQPVRRVGVPVCHHRVIGLQYQRHVLQLVAQCAAAALPGGDQGLRRDAGGLKLVHGGEEHPLQLGFAAGGAVYPEP